MGNTLKRALSVGLTGALLACTFASAIVGNKATQESIKSIETEKLVELPGEYKLLHHNSYVEEQEEIRNEIMYGEIELLAQLIQAEAGNQDELGKRYVSDVVLNRVNDKDFPDTIEEVIFQMNPVQFTSIIDGNFEKAGWTVTEDCYKIALEEYEVITDPTLFYFRTGQYSTSGHPAFIHGDHYFSTK